MCYDYDFNVAINRICTTGYMTATFHVKYLLICDFWQPCTLTPRAERQSAWMSKITNDSSTLSCTWCFIAILIMTTVGVKGLTVTLSTELTATAYTDIARRCWPVQFIFCSYIQRSLLVTDKRTDRQIDGHQRRLSTLPLCGRGLTRKSLYRW